MQELNIGRGGKTVTHGIFEWSGDEARFCMAAAGAPRPSDFSCDPASGRTFSQWKWKSAGSSSRGLLHRNRADQDVEDHAFVKARRE